MAARLATGARDAGLSRFFCLISSLVAWWPSWTVAISLAAINGYLAEAIEHYRTREEVLWLQRTSLLCSSMSPPDILYNYLLGEKQAAGRRNLSVFCHDD